MASSTAVSGVSYGSEDGNDLGNRIVLVMLGVIVLVAIILLARK